MKELVFATHNLHKTEEVRAMLAPDYKVLNLHDIGCTADIPETGYSFTENAALKTAYVREHYGLSSFADDSGLEVEALNNEPGIYSARYSGERGDERNLNYLLRKMDGITNRNAQFRSIISLQLGDEQYFFEGVIRGKLLADARGVAGFGYDPIFVPDGYQVSFAQMPAAEKNKISHRAQAMQQLIQFLKSL